jgi:hypothetical protein
MRNRLSHGRLIFILLAVVCSIPGVYAQKYHISGKVIDQGSLAGIAYVNISILSTRQGCTTNSAGEFMLKTDTLPVNLIISHLNYQTRRIWIESESFPLTILLEPVATMLSEVEIKAKNEPVPYFKDEKYSVLDYEVYDDLVFLLIYKFRLQKSELICKTVFGDTLARSATLDFKPARLFLDCLGCLHVLSADSAYQVFLVKDSMKLAYAYSLQKFNSTMANCVASTEDRLFFREESRDHLTVDFYDLERKTSKKHYLATVSDQEMLTVLYNNPVDHYFLLLDTIPDGNKNMEQWAWVHMIMYKPNASILRKLGDTLALFNTTDGSVDLYSLDGMYLQGLSIPITGSADGDWTKEIYTDDFTLTPYTTFRKNGRLTIYRIDLASGELSQVLKTSHLYPEKLRFQHDHLFYLYDVPGEGDNKHLFRQKL